MADINKLIEDLNGESLDVRIQAAQKLGELGAKDKKAEYALRDRFRIAEDQVELEALEQALEEISLAAVVWAHDLRNRRRNQESASTYAKSLTVTQTKEAVKSLLWLYGDTPPPEFEWNDREGELIAIGQQVPEVIPDLLNVFEGNANLRVILGEALSIIGFERPEVGAGLVPLLRHKDPTVVDAAANVLSDGVKLGANAHEAVETLLELYEGSDGEWEPGEKALVGLGSGQSHSAVVAALVEILGTRPDSSETWTMSRLLGWIVKDSGKRGVNTLLTLLHHPIPVVRKTAVGASSWCLSNKTVIDRLCEATKDKAEGVRMAAASVLSSCPP